MTNDDFHDGRATRQVDHACRLLFDRWCQERNIIPLTYLLHSWPVANTGRDPLKRLAETLRELNKLQPEILGPDAVQTLMGIEDDIEELRKTYHGGK
jgi:hypothetical protein